MIQAGASASVLKGMAAEEVVRAVREVHEGSSFQLPAAGENDAQGDEAADLSSKAAEYYRTCVMKTLGGPDAVEPVRCAVRTGPISAD